MRVSIAGKRAKCPYCNSKEVVKYRKSPALLSAPACAEAVKTV